MQVRKIPKYDSVREIRYLRNDKIYSGNTRLKKSRKVGQKQTPQEISGDLFITGGVVISWNAQLIGITPYQRQNRDILPFSDFCTLYNQQKTCPTPPNSLQK